MSVRAILLGLIFVIIWSSAFTSARIIVSYSSPIAALAIRFFISGLIGIFIALILGQSLKLTRSQWRATIVFGLCQNALYLGLNFFAMQTIEASLASIIASCSLPILLLLLPPFLGLPPASLSIMVFSLLVPWFIIFTHRSNIQRLRNGDENRFEKAMIFRKKN